MANGFCYIKDPIKLGKVLWPNVVFYRKQREIIYSVWENDDTVVPAGHMLGKDFVAGFIALAFFLTRTPCRIVTTSVDHAQLESVLWGEIRRFIQTCKYPLSHEQGGPLVINHLHLRKVVNKQICGLSYALARVASKGEGMSGHHIAQTGDGIPRTLFMSDEASGVDQITYDKAKEWHHRRLIIGNPYECANDFKWAVKGRPGGQPGGDIPRKTTVGGFYRKVIKISAEDSPNVQLGRAQEQAGTQPTGEIIIPGVLPWDTMQKNLLDWDDIKVCVGIKAEFYEGAEVMMFPATWLDHSEQLARELDNRIPRWQRKAKGVGIDPAEGGDKTAQSAVDEDGLIELLAKKTPYTAVITAEAIAFAFTKHNVPPNRLVFDRGGGGKQHADRLEEQGYKGVRSVGFGEAVSQEPKRAKILLPERIDTIEERYAYKNRRAELYGRLRERMDPHGPFGGFAIPREYTELRRQLAPIPLKYDQEGRLYLPPKRKKDKDSEEISLEEIIGCSPDEADSLVLALWAMTTKSTAPVAGPGGTHRR